MCRICFIRGGSSYPAILNLMVKSFKKVDYVFAFAVISQHGDVAGTQIMKFMGPIWGPPGSCRPQMGPMLAPWTLLSGKSFLLEALFSLYCRYIVAVVDLLMQWYHIHGQGFSRNCVDLILLEYSCLITITVKTLRLEKRCDWGHCQLYFYQK